MKKFDAVFCGVLVCMLCACTVGGSPKWLNGKSNAHPDERYLVATGTASDLEDAKSRALANLAKIFEVQVDDSSHDESKAWQKTQNAVESQGNEQLTVRYVDAYATKLLEGASIAEQWYDSAAQMHYALAVISRDQLRARLSGDIRKNDQYSQSALAQSRQTSQQPFLAAQHIFKAQQSQVHRAALQRDLQIVDAKGIGIRPLWTVADLELQINKMLAQMRVSADVIADPVDGLDRSLAGGIAAMSMRYSPEASQPAYILEGKLDAHYKGVIDDWHWFRGALEVRLVTQEGRVMMAMGRWPLKSAGQTKAQAKVRLQTRVLEILTNDMKPVLLGFNKQSP